MDYNAKKDLAIYCVIKLHDIEEEAKKPYVDACNNIYKSIPNDQIKQFRNEVFQAKVLYKIVQQIRDDNYTELNKLDNDHKTEVLKFCVNESLKFYNQEGDEATTMKKEYLDVINKISIEIQPQLLKQLDAVTSSPTPKTSEPTPIFLNLTTKTVGLVVIVSTIIAAVIAFTQRPKKEGSVKLHSLRLSKPSKHRAVRTRKEPGNGGMPMTRASEARHQTRPFHAKP